MHSQENQSYYQSDNEQSRVTFLAFIIFQFIFAIIMLSVFLRITQRERVILSGDNLAKVDIVNDSIIPGLPNSDIAKYIEQALFDSIIANSDTSAASHSLTASFKEDTVSTVSFPNQNYYYFSAIIDVPELSESYQLMLQYSADVNHNYNQPAYIITCPEKNLYPGFKCKDTISREGIISFIGSQIPHFSFDHFSAYMKPENYTTVFVAPISFTVSEADKKTYTDQTRSAISSLGVNPDQFEYFVITANDIVYDN